MTDKLNDHFHLYYFNYFCLQSQCGHNTHCLLIQGFLLSSLTWELKGHRHQHLEDPPIYSTCKSGIKEDFIEGKSAAIIVSI